MPRPGAPASRDRSPGRRCAIYTRKSSEEGLEQEFNSLHAQREACEAYIRSQRHEGWTALTASYDDGGISGGTLERPALQRLLADVRAGRLDLVVVYKVDRLTRSLADFAKIVEAFDAAGVSFVSVTQQFNTTTSMGRLTLNMLLSFAQFEREVTGERIRDKFAASKRKGMWMGGTVPLGYEVRDRKLVVNEGEAATVRHICAAYLTLGSVRLLEERLRAEGVVGKSGRPLARGALFHMLQNRVYRGEVGHKGAVYPGEHAAIVEAELWGRVQGRLDAARSAARGGKGRHGSSPLAGILFDASGERLTPTHAVKAGKRYRYYISHALVTGTRADAREAVRCPAGEVEALVTTRLLGLLGDRAALFRALRDAGALPGTAAEQERVLEGATKLAQSWPGLEPAAQAAMLRRLLQRVELHPERLDMQVNLRRLRHLPFPGELAVEALPSADDTDQPSSISISVSARLRRSGKEVALVIGEGDGARHAETPLARLVARAHLLRAALTSGEAPDLDVLAQREGMGRTYLIRVLRLAYLAPDVIEAIQAGREPDGLTVNKLMKAIQLPLTWDEQRRVLGLA
ncbi:recombinase family protein [Falsiroseomonas sp.]|uniref:recombinase family protein n=1 Tax=Falsiroseomonas sp. TaxID=2870721 RepID=UPI003568F1C8